MTKPIDLIVANVMHETVDTLKAGLSLGAKFVAVLGVDKPPDRTAEIMADPENQEVIVRYLLCQIAHQAALPRVLDALKAVGAPCSLDDIREGFTAAKENAG